MKPVLLATLGMLAACGATASGLPAMPSAGGPAWLEVSTPHFTIWTDAGEARGRELAIEVEHLRQVVIGTAFRDAPSDGRAFVIATRDDDELHRFVPAQFAAMSWPAAHDALHQPVVAMSAFTNHGDGRVTSAHELVHVISYAVIHDQPHWFAEGLAKYYETMHLDATAGTVDLGAAPTVRGQPMRMHHLESLRSLLACRELGCLDAAFYETAWALYTYLANARAGELAQLEQRLAVDHGDGARAWADVFGASSEDAVEAAMRQWLITGSHTVLHFTIHLDEPAIAVRTLAEADVYALRAYLQLRDVHGAAEVAANLARALALEPANVLALVVTYARDQRVDPAAARAAATAHPGDWRAWWLVAAAGGAPADIQAARAKACGLAAIDPAVVLPPSLCTGVESAP